MKKKLLVSAITAAATASTGAFAAIDIETRTTADAPRIASGGTVAFEDQIVSQVAGGTANLDAEDTIVLSLPSGANFVGTPTATSTIGTLRLQANSLGDPGDSGLVTLVDTNNDGQNDRASVVVASAATAGDQVVWSGALTWTGDSSKTTQLKASIFVSDTETGVEALNSDSVLALPVASLTTPLGQLDKDSAITIPLADGNDVAFSGANTSDLILTVPAGTAKDKTIVLTLGSGLAFGATAPTVQVLTDGAPTLTITDGTANDNQFTFELDGATTEASQYIISIADLDVTAAQASAGPVTATLTGDAGLTGSATVAVLGASGSKAALPTGTTAATTKIVAGAEVLRTLPNIVITETFAGDLENGTVTITAGDGLVFDENTAPTVTPAGGITVTKTDVTDSVITLTLGANPAAFPAAVGTITVSGTKAIVEDSASGVVNVEFGGTAANAPESVLNVATAIARGAVEIEGPDPVPSIGAGAKDTKVNITLDEETYAAITDTAANTAFIMITPPQGVTIDSVTQAGLANIEANGEPVVPENGSYLIEVTGESSAAGEAVLTVQYDVAASVPVGTELAFTLSGNANVEGSVVVATVANSTKTTVGTIPSVDVGSVNSQALAPFTITENIGTGLSNGNFRVQAPAGVTFAPGATFEGSVTGTSTVATTFSANDTLLVGVSGTDNTIESLTVKAKVFVAASVADDQLLSFTITDGDLANASKTGITGGTVNLAYTGDVEALDAGDAGTVNVGFTRTNTIEGGMGPFTATSSNENVASVDVDGTSVTVRGLSAGTATITVTDALNSNSTFLVTVAAGAPQVQLGGAQKLGGGTTTAVLTAGATSDAGTSYDTEFTTEDEIDVVATIQPEAADVGQPGEIFAVVRAETPAGTVVWGMLNEDGNFVRWDLRVATLVPMEVTESLDATEYLTIWSGTLGAGTYNVRVGYMVEGGTLIFNDEPLEITISAE